MNTSELFKKSIIRFYLLVFALSIPFWLIGVMAENIPMVEHLFKRLPMNLPVSSLMAFCPLIAALILVYREDKSGGIMRLLKRVFDQNRIKQKDLVCTHHFLDADYNVGVVSGNAPDGATSPGTAHSISDNTDTFCCVLYHRRR